VGDGDRVAPGDTVALLEAMKTESAVPCPVGGTVLRVVCDVGDVVPAGAPLLVVVTDG
jgi:biotin carboxyl carrier protein